LAAKEAYDISFLDRDHPNISYQAFHQRKDNYSKNFIEKKDKDHLREKRQARAKNRPRLNNPISNF
jgi:hypothetical protein